MNKILIIGLGLIGGSFAKALLKHKISDDIHAFDIDQNQVNLAIEEGIIKDFAKIDHKINQFDFIIIATSLSAYESIFKEISKYDLNKTIIIDFASVQTLASKKFPNNLVGCHPIAGSDQSGFANSNAELFDSKKFIITTDKDNNNVKIVINLIKKISTDIEFLDAKTHDEIYALMSHLPQFLSFLTKEFSPNNLEDSFLEKAFRLDESSGKIWSDIFKFNEKNVEKFYLEFFENLQKIVKQIENNDFEKIFYLNINHPKNNFSFDLKKINQTDLTKIIFRILVVTCFLKIKKVNELKDYAGSGFKDFTSIINVLESNTDFLVKSLKENKKEILNLVKKITS